MLIKLPAISDFTVLNSNAEGKIPHVSGLMNTTVLNKN